MLSRLQTKYVLIPLCLFFSIGFLLFVIYSLQTDPEPVAQNTEWLIERNELVAPTATGTTSSIVTPERKNEVTSTPPTPTIIDAPAVTSPSLPVVKSTVTESVEIEPTVTQSFSSKNMLAAHNEVRNNLQLQSLVWSDALSKSAQKWSDTLRSEDCVFRHDPNTPYGENIYWAWKTGEDASDLISNPREVAKWWAAEEAFYNYQKNSCMSGEQCGHYTQMVWKDTTEVGCGVSSCLNGDKQTDVWVCRYNPAGNDGTRPY